MGINRRFVDLHMHSTASDGTTPPEKLIEVARAETVLALAEGWISEEPQEYIMALTDHDTLAGIPALEKAARLFENVRIIPGVEISSDYQGHEIHILGYNVDSENSDLQSGLEYYRGERQHRNRRILGKFRDIGISIPEEELSTRENEAVGRPHIARWLVRHRYAESIRDAFDRFLNPGEPCYVNREKAPAKECIQLIRNAGGIPVLAHPVRYRFLNHPELEKMIRRFTEDGLQGVETYYTENRPADTRYLEALSEKYRLIRTGGSDYHGKNKPNHHMGYGHGNLGETMNRIQVTAPPSASSAPDASCTEPAPSWVR